MLYVFLSSTRGKRGDELSLSFEGPSLHVADTSSLIMASTVNVHGLVPRFLGRNASCGGPSAGAVGSAGLRGLQTVRAVLAPARYLDGEQES